jgi:putative ABC transport system ATP-binding protein
MFADSYVEISGAGVVAGLTVGCRDERADRPPRRVVQAVRPISPWTRADLLIERGELLAVVGPSGSGKSTCSTSSARSTGRPSGSLRIDGTTSPAQRPGAVRVAGPDHRLRLPAVPSRARVPALDIVADGLLYGGKQRGYRRREAERALRRVGLGHRLRHLPHQLSGGEQQRVAVARAVLGDPPLLMADEPTGNLDSVSGAAVMDLLRELHGGGTTVVIITHDRDIASALPREVRLKDGKIAEEVRR